MLSLFQNNKTCDQQTDKDFETLYKNLCEVISKSTNIPNDVVCRSDMTELENRLKGRVGFYKKVQHAVSRPSFKKLISINKSQVKKHTWEVCAPEICDSECKTEAESDLPSVTITLDEINVKTKKVLNSDKYIYKTINDERDFERQLVITKKAQITTLKNEAVSLRKEIEYLKETVSIKKNTVVYYS